jgi:bisanhydrobacterioruberin hydratase
VRSRIKKYQVATAIAILFHTIGLMGLLFFDKTFFLKSTLINLLLMVILLVWTQTGKNRWFSFFLLSCFFIGLGVEMIGVQTGVLFGNYSYGAVMGYKVLDTPLLLGVNWFIVIYCSGMSVYLLKSRQIGRTSSQTGEKKTKFRAIPIILGGALLATFYDWLMEPVAVRLGYWRWNGSGSIPVYNYVSWFLISVLLLSIFHAGKFEKLNKFAVNLMLIQLLFFLLLRVALK